VTATLVYNNNNHSRNGGECKFACTMV